MPRMVAALQRRDQIYEVPDSKVIGLRIVVYPSGARSWAIRYVVGGRNRKHILGPYPRIKVADARRLASKKLLSVHAGKDPAKEKADQLRAAKSGSVAVAFANFDAAHLAKKKSAREQRRIFNKYVLPKIGKRTLVSITKSDVIEILKSISAPAMSNRTFSAMSKFFKWASAYDMIPIPPTIGVQKLYPEGKGRDRTLNDAEIVWFYRACDHVPYPYSNIFRLCLLIGCREGEAASVKWDDLDLPANLWQLTRTKTDNPRTIYLAPIAKALVEAAPGGHDYVFGRKPPSSWSRNKRILTLQMQHLADNSFEGKIPPFRIHDLRRTFRTLASRLGIDRDVARRAVGHKTQGMDAIYDRYNYAPELKDAYLKVAEFIEGLVGF